MLEWLKVNSAVPNSLACLAQVAYLPNLWGFTGLPTFNLHTVSRIVTTQILWTPVIIRLYSDLWNLIQTYLSSTFSDCYWEAIACSGDWANQIPGILTSCELKEFLWLDLTNIVAHHRLISIRCILFILEPRCLLQCSHISHLMSLRRPRMNQ